MKSSPLVPLLAALIVWAQPVFAGVPAPGDSQEAVEAALGAPLGTVELRGSTVLLYPRGEVTLRDGQVEAVDLISEAAYAAEQAALAREREAWQAEKARREQLHHEQGQALKQEKLSSAAFAAQPARERVDYWRHFQIRYPGIDVSAELARALEGYEQEMAELEAQERIAELEARVARAEQEALEARTETEKLRRELEEQKDRKRFGLRYTIDGPTYRPYRHPPPTITIHRTGEDGGATVIHKQPPPFLFRYP